MDKWIQYLKWNFHFIDLKAEEIDFELQSKFQDAKYIIFLIIMISMN